jgi:hypothetical protein
MQEKDKEKGKYKSIHAVMYSILQNYIFPADITAF